MIGETLALVMGDTKIWSAGTFWERNKFTNRTFFAPFAYKKQLNTRKFKVEDLARLNETRKLKCFAEVWVRSRYAVMGAVLVRPITSCKLQTNPLVKEDLHNNKPAIF
jgi:hypothetical protein